MSTFGMLPAPKKKSLDPTDDSALVGVTSSPLPSVPTAPKVSPGPLATPQLPRPRAQQNPALAGLNAEYAPIKQGFDAAQARVDSLTRARGKVFEVAKPQLIVPRNEFQAPHQLSETPGGMTALKGANTQLAQATEARDAFASPLQQATSKFRSFADATNANVLSRAAGLAPLPLPVSAQADPVVRLPATIVTPRPALPAPNSVERPTGGQDGVAGPLGAVPAPTIKTLDGRSGSLASSVDARGVPTYDNASIGRLDARNAANGAATGAPAIAAPIAAGTPAPTLQLNVPRPRTADAYALRQASDANTKAVSDIDSQIFAAGIGGFNSRGKRQLLSDLVGAKQSILRGNQETAGQVAGGDRNAAAATDQSVLDQGGQNQRAQLDDAGKRAVAALQERGANRRTALQQGGENTRALIPRPTPVVDADGNLVSVRGTSYTAVTGADGKKLRTSTEAEQKVTQRRQDALDALAKQAAQFLPANATAPTESDIGTARIRAAQVAGYDMKRDKDGKLYAQIQGEWMPL